MVKQTGVVSVGAPTMLSWGAIFGGTITALGVWVLLYTLGMAIGLVTISDSEGMVSITRGMGAGFGLWSLITPIVALFVGGLVAARPAGIVSRTVGILHGVILWGLTTVLAVALVGWGLTAALNTALRAGATAVGATGQALSGGSGGGQALTQGLGLDAQDLMAPINERLQAQGKPTLTAAQLQSALQDAVNGAIRQGKVDRALLADALARNTALTRGDVEEVAANIEQRWNQTSQQVGAGVERTVASAASKAGMVLWFIFFSQLLSLVSAVLGASIGITRRQRLMAEYGTQAGTPVGSRP